MTYKYLIKCSKCDKPMTIVELYFTKGTSIIFWVICAKCGIDENREADFFQIQADIYKKTGTVCFDGNATVN
jgi:transcription elongation factor Elf1